VDPDGDGKYGAFRTGSHDDLVTAMGLAVHGGAGKQGGFYFPEEAEEDWPRPVVFDWEAGWPRERAPWWWHTERPRMAGRPHGWPVRLERAEQCIRHGVCRLRRSDHRSPV
jgi:hypothetical protein